MVTYDPRPLLLVVDDDPNVLEALEAELVPRFGSACRVETFERPEAVLDAIPRWTREGRSIALAIVDQKMPGITGIELLVRLRSMARADATGALEVGRDEPPPAHHPAAFTRTLLLTGYGGPEVAHAARTEAGADRYREKPWLVNQIEADVTDLLGLFRAAVAHPRAPSPPREPSSEPTWPEIVAADPAAEPDEEGLRLMIQNLEREGMGGEGPPPELLIAFLAGRASPDEVRAVRDSLLVSPAARRAALALSEALASLAGPEARSRFAASEPPRRLHELAAGEPPEA